MVKVIELQVSYICIASRLPLLDLQKENGARMLTVRPKTFYTSNRVLFLWQCMLMGLDIERSKFGRKLKEKDRLFKKLTYEPVCCCPRPLKRLT